jgi:thioesterase domain-containing protein/acyl carrier protein
VDAFPRTSRDKVDRRALDAAAADAVRTEAEYVAPRDHVESRVAAIVADILELERVGLAHDFFEAGGDSLAAVELVAAFDDEFGVDASSILIADDAVVDTASVAALAAFVRAARSADPDHHDRDTVVCIAGRDATEGPPLFLLPGIGGNPIVLRALARRLASRRVYSAWPHGYLHRALPDQSISAIARRFVAGLAEQEPEGPLVLGGYSFGACVAYEMARQLRAAGRPVALLVMIDTKRDGLDDSDGDGEGQVEQYARRLRDAAADRDDRDRDDRAGGARAAVRMLAASASYRVDRAALLATVGILPRPYSKQGRAFVAHHARLLRRYRLRGYGGRMLVLRNEKRRDLDPELGWGLTVTGPIDTAVVPGNHVTILREPNVDDVARAIGAAVERACDPRGARR